MKVQVAGGDISRLEGLWTKAQGRTELKAHQWAKAPWWRGRKLGEVSGKHLGGQWNSPQLGFLEARGVPVPLGVGLPIGLGAWSPCGATCRAPAPLLLT